MKDQEEPIKEVLTIDRLLFPADTLVESTIQLGPNEFHNYDDKIGLFAYEVDPFEFFSIEKFS